MSPEIQSGKILGCHMFNFPKRAEMALHPTLPGVLACLSISKFVDLSIIIYTLCIGTLQYTFWGQSTIQGIQVFLQVWRRCFRAMYYPFGQTWVG
jgi:hypothetical protein